MVCSMIVMIHSDYVRLPIKANSLGQELGIDVGFCKFFSYDIFTYCTNVHNKHTGITAITS